jgi:hypothetical protein
MKSKSILDYVLKQESKELFEKCDYLIQYQQAMQEAHAELIVKAEANSKNVKQFLDQLKKK